MLGDTATSAENSRRLLAQGMCDCQGGIRQGRYMLRVANVSFLIISKIPPVHLV